MSEDDAVAVVEDEEPLNERTEAWMAVGGYRAAMSYILQLGDDPHYEHNVGTIRSLHYMMVGYDLSKNPGRWRPGTIYVRHEPTGEIVYQGPDANIVPQLMDEYINQLNDPVNVHVIVRAAMAHLNLVMIHPFSDGNGRMGRAMQTMVFSTEGTAEPLFSSIEEYLGRYTPQYYEVLAKVGQGAWHPGHDPLPWIKFCLKAHYRQAEEYLLRIRETADLWELLHYEMESRGLNERMTLALIDAAFRLRIRNASYRHMAGVSSEVAGRDLKALCDNGFLIAKGEKRGRYYMASPWLQGKYSEIRQPRKPRDPFLSELEVPQLVKGPEQQNLI